MIDWEAKADYHAREMQAIKRRLRERFGGVFDSYVGVGATEANKLRRELEKHRVAYHAAREHRHPTAAELAPRSGGKRGAQPLRKIRITATVPDDVYQELLRGTKRTRGKR